MKIGVIGPRVLIRKSLCALLSQAQGLHIVLDLDRPSDDPRLICQVRPEIVLVDSASPATDFETLSQLRALLPESKILLLLDRADAEYQLRAIQQGARGFVSNGCDPGLLERALRRVAKGEIWVGHDVATRIIGKFMRWHEAERDGSLQLSRRELEILALLADGRSNKEIATSLSLSANTVRAHLANLYRKIQVTSRLEAALYYFERLRHNGSLRTPFSRQHPEESASSPGADLKDRGRKTS
jgi:two-component system nitrate/nitrite response regulator NarL